MGGPDDLNWPSLVLAVAVASIAIGLALRGWWERRTRESELPARDRKHFFLQDLRRGIGIVLLAFLAIGVYVGCRLPLFAVDPRDSGSRSPAAWLAGAVVQAALETHPNRVFVAVWMGIFAALVVLLGLALIDWISTRRYADRQRREIDRERAELLRDTLRRRPPAADGWANGRSLESS